MLKCISTRRVRCGLELQTALSRLRRRRAQMHSLARVFVDPSALLGPLWRAVAFPLVLAGGGCRSSERRYGVRSGLSGSRRRGHLIGPPVRPEPLLWGGREQREACLHRVWSPAPGREVSLDEAAPEGSSRPAINRTAGRGPDIGLPGLVYKCLLYENKPLEIQPNSGQVCRSRRDMQPNRSPPGEILRIIRRPESHCPQGQD